MGLTTNVAMFLKSVFTILGVYVILFMYSWKNTLIAIGFLIPMFIIMPLWARLTQFTQKQY
jgi:ABC-type multidrug transport system fused ATPase/permease subunit